MTAASQSEHRQGQTQDRPGDLFPDPSEALRAGTVLFRGGVFTVMVLRVGDPKSQAFYDAVMAKIAQSPAFFRNAPIVLDLQDLAAAPPFNIAELVRRLKQHLLVPVGVQNATDEQAKTATNAGLSLFPEGRAVALDAATPRAGTAPAPIQAAAPAPAVPAPPAAAPAPAKMPVATADAAIEASTASGGATIVTRTVRSGQQVTAPHSDMVVLASTSPGAELLADGHIHVYGTLRGRAHAGAGGNTQARIFCRALEAELVSIAGYWRVREDLPEALIGQPAHIYLDGERVQVEPLV